ncbi:MAG: SRPBCC family protein [Saprospiraceae bacterium]|nr:SRPBCC family protein [Saprospiraceae bacterium]
MKLLKTLLYIILGLGAAWVILGLFAKKVYHIERSMPIDAPKEMVYEQVRYFKNFETWSPWSQLDPRMETSISGPDGQVGAVYTWNGNDAAGSGQQTITAIHPDRIDLDVHISKPFASQSPSYLRFEERGDTTVVHWIVDFQIAFPWNALAMFTDVDAALGKDYVKGLENLRALCEAMAHKKYRGYEIEAAPMAERWYAGWRKTIPIDEIPAYFSTQIPVLLSQIQTSKLVTTGPLTGLFWEYDEEAGSSDLAVAIPVEAGQKPGAGLAFFTVGGPTAVILDFFGAYDSLGMAHFALDDYLAENGLRQIPPVLEEYIAGPSQEPDTARWHTRVIYFVGPAADSSALAAPAPKGN